MNTKITIPNKIKDLFNPVSYLCQWLKVCSWCTVSQSDIFEWNISQSDIYWIYIYEIYMKYITEWYIWYLKLFQPPNFFRFVPVKCELIPIQKYTSGILVKAYSNNSVFLQGYVKKQFSDFFSIYMGCSKNNNFLKSKWQKGISN